MTGRTIAAGCSSGSGAARAVRTAAVAFACLALGACAQSGLNSLDLAGPSTIAEPDAPSKDNPVKAVDAAGKAFAKEPRSADKALAYARALKSLGEKRQALAVLQQAAMFNGNHRALNSEYGRLALEFDQVSLAQRLLEAADDPGNPDWRVISARGTAVAKQGNYRDAIPLYERALALAPNQPSVLNNLALAYTMEGNPDKAEPLLKSAAAAGEDARINQNLALVLGLQGKYEDARTVAARNMAPDKAAADVDYVRRIVMLDPRTSRPEQATGSITKAPRAQPQLRGPSHEDEGAWAPNVAAAGK